jgi:hypothetical protein
LLLRDETGVIRDTCTPYTLQPHTGTSKIILNYGRVVAFNIPDGADIAQNQALADFNSTYTPTEVAAQVTLPGSTMRRIQDPDLQTRVARMLNNAYDLKEDQDGAVQFASFTASNLGGAGTVISPGHAAAYAGQLRVGINRTNPEPAPEPLFLTMHPLTAVALAGRLIPYATTPAGGTAYGVAGGAHVGTSMTLGYDSGGLAEGLMTQGIGRLGQIAGLDIRQDANIVPVGADANCCGYSKEGMIYVSELEPRIDPDTSDKSLRGAVELNCWGSYAFGVYRAANYGLLGLFDASLPTS